MSTEFEPIEDFETLLDLRIQLKQYKKKGAAHTLAILKRIKKAALSREQLMKTRVTRTIKHLSKLKFDEPNIDEANMLKYSQFLINTWRKKMFNKEQVEYPPINYKKQEEKNEEKKPEKQQEQKQTASDLPDLKNVVRNKGLAGIKKYLKNNTGQSEEKILQLCIELEQNIFKKFEQNGDMDEEKTKEYKLVLKGFCTSLLNQKNGQEICDNITSGKISTEEAINQN